MYVYTMYTIYIQLHVHAITVHRATHTLCIRVFSFPSASGSLGWYNCFLELLHPLPLSRGRTGTGRDTASVNGIGMGISSYDITSLGHVESVVEADRFSVLARSKVVTMVTGLL